MSTKILPLRRKALVIALMGMSVYAPTAYSQSISIVPAESLAWGVSASGQVVVGQINGIAGAEAFLWTSLTGMTRLGLLGGGANSYAYAVNAPGNVVVGASENAFLNNEAFIWTHAAGMTGLGFLPGGSTSQATGVSADGSVVVGLSDNSSGLNEAFHWTSGGMTGLGILSGGSFSEAHGVSADGSVVVGFGDSGSGLNEAFRWAAGSMAGLGFLPGGSYSEAHGISADGSVVVGFGDNSSGLNEAFRWTAGGMAGLGFLPGGSSSKALAVSSDGAVVVGKADDALGENFAFRWTAVTAIQSVEDWLSAAGASISGWHLVKATGISADGTVVVGQGEDVFGTTKAFIARVNADGGTGIIDPIVWMGTLAGARDGFYAGQSQMALPLEGAHHRTLLSLDNGGQRFGVWLTGEGTYRTEGENARLGLGEVGIYTDLLPGLRIGLGAAKSDQQQNLPYSGAARLDGRYWLAEVGWQPRSMPVQLSLTTMAGKWDTRINRAYENGGGIDVSPGDAPVEGHSVRLRLDVPDAWTFGRTAMTPYAAYTETHTRMAAYAESGGAFPASYQAQEHTAREARLGLRLSRTMTETVAVHGHIEAVHRFDRTGARLSGSELSGLLPFDFAGAKIKRNSMRLGLDMDYRLALGTTLTASFMTATPGEDPVVSAAVGVRFSF